MLKKICAFLGFAKNIDTTTIYPDNFSFKDNIDLKLEYLKALETQEGERQTTLETKTSQLIGQTGLIFSLVGLFIPLYIDKFNHFSAIYQIILITVFSLTLLFYFFTIVYSTKYLNVKNYPYARRSTDTVKKVYETNDDFKIEEIKDLIYSIEKNTKLNSNKADNLIYAYRAFRRGNFLTGIFSVLLLMSIWFVSKEETPKILIENPIEMKGLESSVNNLADQLEKKNIITIGDSIKVIYVK